MRITYFENQPFHILPFLNAGKGQGNFYKDQLPIHLANVDKLPDDLDAIIATADLQGRETFGKNSNDHGPPRLLGEVLPNYLCQDILPTLGIEPQRCGVILGGDFYTVPNLDKRGGSGDVTEVWNAFEQLFRWVTGVAGNHDEFPSQNRNRQTLPRNLLDVESKKFDSLKISGLSGIVGDPKRKWRKWQNDYEEYFRLLLQSQPDIVVTHDGPCGTVPNQRGNSNCHQIAREERATLMIRGHAHWYQPFCELSNGSQILNVDARVAILTRLEK